MSVAQGTEEPSRYARKGKSAEYQKCLDAGMTAMETAKVCGVTHASVWCWANNRGVSFAKTANGKRGKSRKTVAEASDVNPARDMKAMGSIEARAELLKAFWHKTRRCLVDLTLNDLVNRSGFAREQILALTAQQKCAPWMQGDGTVYTLTPRGRALVLALVGAEPELTAETAKPAN